MSGDDPDPVTRTRSNRPSRWVAWLDRTLYPNHGDRWDDELFRLRILPHLRPESRMLDLGAGAGRVPQMNFRGRVAWVAGVDPDEGVRRNPFLDEAHVAGGEALPFADASLDVVFSDNVLEHLARPAVIFAEVSRVLRPMGIFLVKTPNRWHYMTLIARLTPFWFHRFVNRLRGRPPEHTFPTLYRANTAKRLRQLADQAGLSTHSIERVEGRPEYMRVSAPSYLVGALYERIVNSTPRLERFRVVLIGVFEQRP